MFLKREKSEILAVFFSFEKIFSRLFFFRLETKWIFCLFVCFLNISVTWQLFANWLVSASRADDSPGLCPTYMFALYFQLSVQCCMFTSQNNEIHLWWKKIKKSHTGSKFSGFEIDTIASQCNAKQRCRVSQHDIPVDSSEDKNIQQ